MNYICVISFCLEMHSLDCVCTGAKLIAINELVLMTNQLDTTSPYDKPRLASKTTCGTANRSRTGSARINLSRKYMMTRCDDECKEGRDGARMTKVMQCNTS
jgi:hypothetical protein